MTAYAFAATRPLGVSSLLVAVLFASTAAALPNGAPWEAALDGGCAKCHLDAPAVESSTALQIDGLPERITPGMRYGLVVRLSAADLRKGGFLLSAWTGQAPAGRFAASDARTESNAAQVRSTAAGAAPLRPGVAEWRVEWTAPASGSEPVRFELWANAGNDDASPLGDATHRREWRVSAPR